jgi:hypothetical protein
VKMNPTLALTFVSLHHLFSVTLLPGEPLKA